MNAINCLQKLLNEVNGARYNRDGLRVAKNILEHVQLLIKTDIELNDDQYNRIRESIFEIAEIDSKYKHELIHIKGLEFQLATYINSCYRPK